MNRIEGKMLYLETSDCGDRLPTIHKPEVQRKRVVTETQKTQLYGEGGLRGAADSNGGCCHPTWSWQRGAMGQPEEFTLYPRFPSFL